MIGTEGQGIPAGDTPSNSMPWGMPVGQALAQGGTTHTLDISACSNGPRASTVERAQPLIGAVITPTVPVPVEGVKMTGVTGMTLEGPPRASQTYAMELGDYEAEERVPLWKEEIEKLNSIVKNLQGGGE